MNLTSLLRTGACCAATALFGLSVNAQLTDHLFGIHNPSSGVFAFCKLELSTGIVTDLEPMPFNSVSSISGGLVDTGAERYLYCTGQELYTLDPLDIAPMQVQALPIVPSADFIHAEYNPCDSMLYGIVNDPPTSITFSKYDRTTNTMTPIVALSNNMFFAMGGMSYIDPVSQVYGLEHTGIMGIDIANATVLYDNAITDPPGESFGHISFDCGTGQVLGTSFGPASEGGDAKWLAVLDPWTGLVSHLGPEHTDQALWKPAMTGSCIDQANGIFYWGGVSGAWVGADVVTGDIVYTQIASSTQPIFGINHFSGCSCAPMGMGHGHAYAAMPYPNPANAYVTFAGTSANATLHWSAADGRAVHVPTTFTGATAVANVTSLPEGIYMVRTTNGGTWRVMVAR